MTVPNPAQERVYPLTAPADDRRFSLGLTFDVAKVLTEHGFPEITSGGDLVALQQTLYGFLYRAPEQPDAANYRDGYATGYVDCVVEKAKMAAESERPSSSLEESRDRLVVSSLSALITIGMIDKESADALVSLWRRRDHLTPVELDAIRAAAAGGPPVGDDGGFAEEFLQQQRAARRAAKDAQ